MAATPDPGEFKSSCPQAVQAGAVGL